MRQHKIKKYIIHILAIPAIGPEALDIPMRQCAILACTDRDNKYLSMFPEKQKSGVSTKKLQLFKTLEAPCSDEAELMEAAVSAGPRRIVVKRPVKGPFLAGKKAGHSIVCRNIRYDCYTVN